MVSAKKKDFWITYDENPFDFFKQPEEWYWFDMLYGRILHQGFDICGLIASYAPTSDENLTDYENDELINEAINFVLDKYADKYNLKLCFKE